MRRYRRGTCVSRHTVLSINSTINNSTGIFLSQCSSTARIQMSSSTAGIAVVAASAEYWHAYCTRAQPLYCKSTDALLCTGCTYSKHQSDTGARARNKNQTTGEEQETEVHFFRKRSGKFMVRRGFYPRSCSRLQGVHFWLVHAVLKSYSLCPPSPCATGIIPGFL